LVADPYIIVGTWRNYFSQLLNVHKVNGFRHREMHTAEPLLSEPSAFEFVLAIEEPIGHKSQGFDQIWAELI